MYKRKSSDKQIDEVIYKAEHDGFGLNKEELDAYMADYPFGNGANPIGTIIAFMGNIPPIGYLACDGSEYDIVDYPKLAKFFKDQFGSTQYFGGTDDKFAVPDLRGEFLRGTGTNSHSGNGNGAAVGTHQNATKVMYQSINTDNYYAGWGRGAPTDVDATVGNSKGTRIQGSASTGSFPISYATRPTNTSILYCIKADTVTIDELDDTYLLGYDKYSIDEQVVGCWTNGKPLYQKTVEVTLPTVSSNGTFEVTDTTLSSLNINNVDHIFIEDSHLIHVNNGGTHSLPLTYITNGNFQIKTYIYNNSAIRAISSFSDYSGHKVYVTLRYTKTTDPVNSFSITQLSNFKKVTNEANNYSLEEKVIGTWIDGKPLYQKTYSGTTGTISSSSRTKVLVDGDISDKDIIDTKVSVKYINTYGTGTVYEAWYSATNNYVEVIAELDRELYILLVGTHFSNQSYIVTIQYTKRTD